jgi:lysophospholipase L1-like esterase
MIKILSKLGIGLGTLFLLSSFIKNKKNNTIKNVLFIGDSMTTIRDKSGNENDSFFNYPNLIKKMKIAGLNIDVLAIAGKTTQWMKDELPKQLDLKKYDDVFIFGGTNDVFRGVPVSDIVKNVQDMVDSILKKGAKPYVIVGYDTKDVWEENLLNHTQWGLKSKDDILNTKQKYIDYQNTLTKDIKNAKTILINMGKGTTYDGVHPNLLGNKIIAENIVRIIT